MRITSSTVAMNSEWHYAHFAEMQTAELITTADQAATLEFSEEAGNLLKQLEDNESHLEQQRKERQQKSLAEALSRQNTEPQKTRRMGDTVRTPEDLEIKMLRQMLAALRAMREGKHYRPVKPEPDRMQSEREQTAAATPSLSQWVKTTVTSAFVAEAEHTAYQATGMAKTADGREISFGVTLEMSRSFCARYESLVQEDYVCVDPLVINLDFSFATVTEQKFLFDIDADGSEESISFTGEGSGFLALDKNGDGKINDGSELFGTKSGNGFRDLAIYDEDGNGWIDEGDSVFRKLKVWTKDAEGRDKLVNLKAADVGAIYLGYADTEFSLNEAETNAKNGVIRSTGVFLKESGGSGTVQHVDLAI